MINSKNPTSNRNRGLLTILGTITVFLVVLQILVFIFFSNQASMLTQINQEQDLLLLENNQLEKEITQLTSLPTLEERAKKIGFVIPSRENSWSSVIYLAKQLPIAAAN
ncbi:MAG: hypothetical protein PHX72_02430 [Candidatus Shapirobacteria bacterium]|nr:hypothetical protein [Candidatus Shapirobacteria bacterium]